MPVPITGFSYEDILNELRLQPENIASVNALFNHNKVSFQGLHPDYCQDLTQLRSLPLDLSRWRGYTARQYFVGNGQRITTATIQQNSFHIDFETNYITFPHIDILFAKDFGYALRSAGSSYQLVMFNFKNHNPQSIQQIGIKTFNIPTLQNPTTPFYSISYFSDTLIQVSGGHYIQLYDLSSEPMQMVYAIAVQNNRYCKRSIYMPIIDAHCVLSNSDPVILADKREYYDHVTQERLHITDNTGIGRAVCFMYYQGKPCMQRLTEQFGSSWLSKLMYIDGVEQFSVARNYLQPFTEYKHAPTINDHAYMW
jgi:hypothetical protein